jgi:hypothetical protein
MLVIRLASGVRTPDDLPDFMSRTVVLCTLLFAACDVGSVIQHATTADGGGSGSGSGSSDDPLTACGSDGVIPGPSHTHAGNTSNAGVGCMSNMNCHSSAMPPAKGGAYAYAGTVYDTAGAPKPGATIFVFINNKSIKMLSNMDGNFFLPEGLGDAPSSTLTGKTTATLCPTIKPMGSSLIAGSGNCNNGGSCHGSVGAIGATGKIHL